MKKFITLCLIVCALSISSNSFCIPTRAQYIARTRKAFIPPKAYLTSHKVKEQLKEINVSLQEISVQLKENKEGAEKNNELLHNILSYLRCQNDDIS